jgi:hypothetical protein
MGITIHSGDGLGTPLIVKTDAHQRQAFGDRAIGGDLRARVDAETRDVPP